MTWTVSVFGAEGRWGRAAETTHILSLLLEPPRYRYSEVQRGTNVATELSLSREGGTRFRRNRLKISFYS
jgi:hypothetical protein